MTNRSNRCVEGKADGLRDGDECTDEVEAYKKCRQLVREAKKLGDAKKTVSAATSDGEQHPR